MQRSPDDGETPLHHHSAFCSEISAPIVSNWNLRWIYEMDERRQEWSKMCNGANWLLYTPHFFQKANQHCCKPNDTIDRQKGEQIQVILDIDITTSQSVVTDPLSPYPKNLPTSSLSSQIHNPQIKKGKESKIDKQGKENIPCSPSGRCVFICKFPKKGKIPQGRLAELSSLLLQIDPFKSPKTPEKYRPLILCPSSLRNVQCEIPKVFLPPSDTSLPFPIAFCSTFLSYISQQRKPGNHRQVRLKSKGNPIKESAHN